MTGLGCFIAGQEAQGGDLISLELHPFGTASFASQRCERPAIQTETKERDYSVLPSSDGYTYMLSSKL